MDALVAVALVALVAVGRIGVFVTVAVVRDRLHGRPLPLVRLRAEFFEGRAAPRAGEGAVEVPSARVTVIHDAGRLSS